MSAIVFEIDFADSRWWFRSPAREFSFPSKIEAIQAALRGDFAAFSELSDPMERARKCLDMFL